MGFSNSFGDTIPLPEMPLEPLAMDAPIEIPPDLRPLGTKRRYLRTLQLLADQLPENETIRKLESTATSPSRPTGRLLRHQNSMSSKQLLSSKRDRKLLKFVSQKDLMSDRRLSMKRRSSHYMEEKEIIPRESVDEGSQQAPATDDEELTITVDPAPSSTAMSTGSRSSTRLVRGALGNSGIL